MFCWLISVPWLGSSAPLSFCFPQPVNLAFGVLNQDREPIRNRNNYNNSVFLNTMNRTQTWKTNGPLLMDLSEGIKVGVGPKISTEIWWATIWASGENDKWWCGASLVLVVGVDIGALPVIPATMCHQIVEVRVGVDYPGVLAHGSPHVEWSCARDPAANKCEPRLFLLRVSVLCRNGTEPSGYWMYLTVLYQCRTNIGKLTMFYSKVFSLSLSMKKHIIERNNIWSCTS